MTGLLGSQAGKIVENSALSGGIDTEAKMNQEYQGTSREAQIKQATIDFLRKKISGEELERIRNQPKQGYPDNNFSNAGS